MQAWMRWVMVVLVAVLPGGLLLAAGWMLLSRRLEVRRAAKLGVPPEPIPGIRETLNRFRPAQLLREMSRRPSAAA